MYGASSLLGPLWVTRFLHAGLGWRAPIGWLGVGSLLVSAGALGAGRRGIWALPPAPVGTALRGPLVLDPATDRRRRPISAGVYYGLICMCYVTAELVIATRLPLYARRDWAYSASAANALLSAYFLGLFAGRFAFAVVHFPWGSRGILACSASSGLVCFALGLLHDPRWLAAAGLCFSVFYPATMALIGDEHGASGATTFVTSWCVTLQAVGLMAMHLGVGSLSDRVGLGRALWVGPVALAITLVLVAARRPGPPLAAQT